MITSLVIAWNKIRSYSYLILGKPPTTLVGSSKDPIAFFFFLGGRWWCWRRVGRHDVLANIFSKKYPAPDYT